jgi:hypothetical protein
MVNGARVKRVVKFATPANSPRVVPCHWKKAYENAVTIG